MDTSSYWIDTAPLKTYPPLRADLTVDVLVVGAGVTGITTAYLLQRAGFRIALIERERIASIDTGHTTAHLTYVTDASLNALVKAFGRDNGQAVWDAGAAAIDEIERIVAEENIACEFSRAPGFQHVPVFAAEGENDRTELKEEAELALQLGFDAEVMEKIPLFNVFGVRYPNQAKFHPRKYLGALVDRIASDEKTVFEKSAVEEFDAEKRRAKVNGHWITFDRVVMATNNPLVGLASMTSATLFQTKLSLYSSYVVGAKVATGSLPIAMFWDTADPYHYLRVDRHDGFDYAVFGGEDYKTGQVADTEECYRRLKEKLKSFAPDAEVDLAGPGR